MLFRSVRDWHERYGIDFTPLLDAAAGRDHDTTIRARRARDWPPLGPAVRLADIDLTRPHPGTIRTATSLPIDRDGRLSALVLSFVAHLAPGIELSTLPEDVSATNSWTSLAWLPGTPPAAAAGARIGVDYSFTPRGSAFTLQSAVTA